MSVYLLIVGFIFCYSMWASRLEKSIITAPMVFIGFGTLLAVSGVVATEEVERWLHVIAEVTLVILLFLDAAKIDQRAILRRRVWPARMLVIGVPLAFLIGTGLGLVIFSEWSMAAIALAAAILVPTDAALGQSVISNPNLPERPRRALTVESGLNDGLALPLVLVAASFAAPEAMAPAEGWTAFTLKQIILGPLVGVCVGLFGGAMLVWAKKKKITAEVYEGIGAIALAASAYLAATLVDGNGFIAAFVGGLGFGFIVRGRCAFVYEFTESEGQLFSWVAFLLIGLVLVPDAIAALTTETVLYILGSLLIVRPLAILIALVGTDASILTRLFFGWFGPRGLATALFALLVVDQLDYQIGENILHLAVNAVWMSAVLHGISAAPGARWYARALDKRGDCAETQPIKSFTKI